LGGTSLQRRPSHEQIALADLLEPGDATQATSTCRSRSADQHDKNSPGAMSRSIPFK
jgi:hypothetical protein